MLEELKANSRVIGGLSQEGSDLAKTFYDTFVHGDCSIASGPEAAEMVKLAENSFRDLNIAFANQLSRVADEHSINAWEVIKQANRHLGLIYCLQVQVLVVTVLQSILGF